MKRLVVARRISQSFFLCLFVYVLWSTTYPLTGVISAQALFKADPLIMLATIVSERIILPGAVWMLAMAGLTIVFGRFFCGWMCPLGTLIDLAGSQRKNRHVSDAANARNEEDEMSGEIWYSVAKHDVFPETFGPFLLGNPRVREAFMRHHADLLEPEFWQQAKERIQQGEVIDFFPYGVHRRFEVNGGKPGMRELADPVAAGAETPADQPDTSAPVTVAEPSE